MVKAIRQIWLLNPNRQGFARTVVGGKFIQEIYTAESTPSCYADIFKANQTKQILYVKCRRVAQGNSVFFTSQTFKIFYWSIQR
jgi:hypothetical protein